MKGSAALRAAIQDLWALDEPTRLAAAGRLRSRALELADLRQAMPALTTCLGDPSQAVRLAVLGVLEARGSMGADIGMAVPALHALCDEPDAEVAALAREALGHAHDRLKIPRRP